MTKFPTVDVFPNFSPLHYVGRQKQYYKYLNALSTQRRHSGLRRRQDLVLLRGNSGRCTANQAPLPIYTKNKNEATQITVESKEETKEQVEHQEDEHGNENQGQSPESVDEFSSFIKRNTNDLIYFISTQFGFLDALVSNDVLTAKQVSLIQEKNTYTGQAKQLIEDITRESISEEKKEAFFKALDQTQLKHVSNWIRGKGERAAEFEDHWPLFYCTEFRRIDVNRSKIIELVDSKNGLLDEMFSADCINYQQKHLIDEQTTDKNQNTQLYCIVYWGSLAAYRTFIRCLLKTNQHQVVFLLAPSLVGDTRPLSDYQQSQLQKSYPILVRSISSKDGLIEELYAAECITWRQKEYIEHPMITQSESNTRLIDIVRRGSKTNFHKFIECLNKTGQHHVSHILTEDGAVAHVVANISSANNREQQERRIVDQLMELLRETPDERREDSLVTMFQEAKYRLNQLRENEVTLITAETEHSIGLFYFTTSLRGLQYLYDIYANEQLKSLMQEIFIALLKTDDAVVDLSVDTLLWDLSNYTDCLQQLCTFTNLSVLSHVYEMAKQNQQLVDMFDDVRSIPIDQFPFELFEMILIRATGHLFVTINRRTPRAEVYTLATMTAVSHLWWVTLSYRKFLKRSLKRSFKRVCHPFKCSPQQVTSLHIEGGNNVVGVAVLKNELFVATEGSSQIHVFDSRPPFSRQEDIQVEGLNPCVSDITICNKSSSLFIADYGTECAIWRVNLLAIKQSDKLIAMQWRPLSLSVNNSRLLITPLDGDSLYLYGDDGNELHHIKLPQYMYALHAIETTHKTYLVSHFNRDNVTEVDVNGGVVRSFNDRIDLIHFNRPRYMLLDNNHVIIADYYNDRIISLKSNLQLKRILINSLHGELPHRLCLTSSRLLAISYFASTDIDIYQV